MSYFICLAAEYTKRFDSYATQPNDFYLFSATSE